MRSEKEIIEAMRRAIERETLEPTSDSIAKAAYAVIAADMAELRAMKKKAVEVLQANESAAETPYAGGDSAKGAYSAAYSIISAGLKARGSHAL